LSSQIHCYIFEFISPIETIFVNKLHNENSLKRITSASISIQKFYRRRRIIAKYLNEDEMTNRTMLRYYIAKNTPKILDDIMSVYLIRENLEDITLDSPQLYEKETKLCARPFIKFFWSEFSL
jgi:hypothetical protein